MSDKLPKESQNEEVDLGQLFKMIGQMFDRLFGFIRSIFYKIFLGFVWIVFFTKKHILKFIVAGILGVVLGYLFKTTSEPVYESYITVKQNYDTGENLYNSISYYNALLKQDDYETLRVTLGIEIDAAESISEFDIHSVVSDNDKLKAYDNYLKKLDTSVAKMVDYETFLENDVEQVHPYQEIVIKAKKRNNFKEIFDNIVDNIESNEYFKREQEKDILELNARKQALMESLKRSDSLQATYKKVLEKSIDNNGSEIGITFEGNNEKDKTKEYELYLNDIEIRRELVEIEREIADKDHIIEIVSKKLESGFIDDKIDVFGQSLGYKLFYGLLLIIVTFIVLLALELIRFLEKYRTEF